MIGGVFAELLPGAFFPGDNELLVGVEGSDGNNFLGAHGNAISHFD